jgi:hypothetical protein
MHNGTLNLVGISASKAIACKLSYFMMFSVKWWQTYSLFSQSLKISDMYLLRRINTYTEFSFGYEFWYSLRKSLNVYKVLKALKRLVGLSLYFSCEMPIWSSGRYTFIELLIFVSKMYFYSYFLHSWTPLFFRVDSFCCYRRVW